MLVFCRGGGIFVAVTCVCVRASCSPNHPGRAGLLRNRGNTVPDTGAARPSGVTVVKTNRMCRFWNTCRDKQPPGDDTDGRF